MSRDKNRPPLLALRLLKWFCKPEYHADIEGDLVESFHENVDTKGLKKARWFLVKDLLQLFRLGIIKPLSPMRGYSSGLWKSNVKSAVRNLIRKKEYALVNILGLSLGIASTLLVLLYVQYELSYDKSLPDAGQIYKLIEEQKSANGVSLNRTVPYSFARILPEDFPEVKSATAFSGPYSGQQVYIKSTEGKRIDFLEDNVFLADDQFFSVFNFRLIKGNASTALKEPNSVVLTKSTARRFFGDTDPIGQFISAAGKNSIVTGICEDVPENSHLKFSYLVSSSSVVWFNSDDFTLKSTHCYLKLQPGTSVARLESKFPAMVSTHLAGAIERINQTSWEAFQEAGNGFSYYLKALTAIHLGPDNVGGMKPGGSIQTMRILIAIAILIFGIACVNFINLATARSAERAKEVGIRKVMGSYRYQLVIQFLTESITLSFVSIMLALGIIVLTLPYFNQFIDRELVLSPNLSSVLALFALGGLIGLLAGIYPALALSSFKPVTTLKGNIAIAAKGKWARNSLLVFQFWIAILLIICTFTIRDQVSFIADKDLGFDKEHLVVVEGTFDRRGNFAKPFLDQIKYSSQVEGAAGSLWIQGLQGTRNENYIAEGSDERVNLQRVTFGDGFAEVMGLALAEGDFFSHNHTDSTMVLINEAAVKQLKLTNPVGKRVVMMTSDRGTSQKTYYTVKGVVKDFNYASLHEEIAPMIMLSNELYAERMSVIAVRLKAGKTREGIAVLKKKWETLIPDRPFRYRFLDKVLDNRYKSEQRSSQVFSLFSGLSILISVMGLFALSAYTVSIRSKEIGIRKVIGASVSSILKLLSLGFSKMVLISFLLAFPVAWYAMETWLNDFAYRVTLNPSIFVLSGGLILIITWLTVGYQSLKAARINPLKQIQSE